MTEKNKIAVCYGGGVNSTAILCGLHERGIIPDAIVFSDVGAENPKTYEHIKLVSDWCISIGFPEITIVTAPNKLLEQDCIDRNSLPAIAFGFKTCSLRFKSQPFEKWKNNNGFKGCTKLIGIDAGEHHRAKHFEGTEYPLIEWNWDREDCVEAIKRVGLPVPPKSSCFFCPSMKPKEILELKRNNPDLLERALFMERNADLTSIKGLGRSFAWAALVQYDNDQTDMFRTTQEIPCECYDG